MPPLSASRAMPEVEQRAEMETGQQQLRVGEARRIDTHIVAPHSTHTCATRCPSFSGKSGESPRLMDEAGGERRRRETLNSRVSSWILLLRASNAPANPQGALLSRLYRVAARKR